MRTRHEEEGGLYDETRSSDQQVVYRITGVFFSGAAASIGSVLDRMIVDFAAVPFLDSTGANVMEGLAHKARRRGVRLFVAGASPEIRRALQLHGLRPPQVGFATTVEDALAQYDEAHPGHRSAGQEGMTG